MTAPATEMSANGDDAELRREGDRIAQLIDDLSTVGGEPVRQRAEELVRRLVHLYGAGLAGLMGIFGAGGLGETTKAQLAAHPLVSSLLLLHGLHPDPGAAQSLDPDARSPPSETPQPGAPTLVQIDLARGRGDRAGPPE
jgi:hypothetical protein